MEGTINWWSMKKISELIYVWYRVAMGFQSFWFTIICAKVHAPMNMLWPYLTESIIVYSLMVYDFIYDRTQYTVYYLCIMNTCWIMHHSSLPNIIESLFSIQFHAFNLCAVMKAMMKLSQIEQVCPYGE